MSLHRSIALLLLLVACGGAQDTEDHAERVDTVGQETPEPTDTGPWAELRGQALRNYVQERALAKLAELDPAMTPEGLAAAMADESEDPILSGKAVERLYDLAVVALTSGELDRAEAIVRFVRRRARNRNSAFGGNTILSETARRRAADQGAEAMRDAIAEVFREQPRTRFGASTVIFQIFQTQEQLQAALGQTHEQLVSLETASRALFFEQVLPPIVEHREQFLAAVAVVTAEHEAQPAPEAYSFGTVDLTGARDAQEVRIGVWDVGTNPALFEEQLFVNEAETAGNGEDDDGNGQVDDVHGVASDVGEYTNAQLLYEPSAETLEEYTPFLQGIMDLRAGIASSEAAQRVLALMRSVTDPEALEELEKNLDAVGEWAHGTHVAGIMLQGLPQARLAIFRSAWAGEARLYHHRGPSDEELAAERANIDAIAEFTRRHEIRVVNASLGFSREYVEDALRHERDTYTTDEAVRERAAEVHRQRAANWRAIFEACPDTLFVVAAGNSNQDVEEYDVVPASFGDLPNLLVIGAVDRYGDWATFTNSNPEIVRVFDFGVEVPSLIPDGQTVPLSGTSMASPNAANLAAKILAVHPGLTPPQVITIIRETGDAIEAPFYGVIANETNALERARRERPRRRGRR